MSAIGDSPTRRMRLFVGAPFKSLFWRLMGVRIGRKVHDGCPDLHARGGTALNPWRRRARAQVAAYPSAHGATFPPPKGTVAKPHTSAQGKTRRRSLRK